MNAVRQNFILFLLEDAAWEIDENLCIFIS